MARRKGKVKNINNRSWFLRGMVIGGIAGTALSLLETKTRKQTIDLLTQVKENPTEVKEQVTEKVTEAAMKVQHVLEDTQDAYNNASSKVFE
ncbi:YtxH domain-containing protein [Peribacillus deserti]|uniref:YtxH domain-containing protein n=1 Tax=Peribacillus deserti TaxID=673318 RepID=A0A2N5M8H7_9BACI|nr:YtxH domain-containing protein [Peribacillus deserti]PLT30645.1 hypothetical protein CUU66_06750 [Peribacillus deserti]